MTSCFAAVYTYIQEYTGSPDLYICLPLSA